MQSLLSALITIGLFKFLQIRNYMFFVNLWFNLLMFILSIVIVPALTFALIWILQAGCQVMPIPIFCDIMESIYGFIIELLT